ncbi:MAG: dihydroorotate dehydrogenase electron transfer subunit [Planctomycetota bacterium]
MKGRVASNLAIGGGWRILEIVAPQLAARSRAGQFLQVRAADGDDPLVRRPFSIYDLLAGPEETASSLRLLFQVVGPGTRFMARLEGGDLVDLLGPLGTPFPLPDPSFSGELLLVGGGIGVAPLHLYARERLQDRPAPRLRILLGARREELLVGREAFEKLGLPTIVATDDGSAGHRGSVVELLEEVLQDLAPGQVFGIGCGPHGMNRALRDLAVAHGLDFWISLENTMPCGFGACFGCVIPTAGSPSPPRYRRVCVEGPAFRARDLPEAF